VSFSVYGPKVRVEVPTDALSTSGVEAAVFAPIVTVSVLGPVSSMVDGWVALYTAGPPDAFSKPTTTATPPVVPSPVTAQESLVPGGLQESIAPTLPLLSPVPACPPASARLRPAGAVVIVAACVPGVKPDAATVRTELPPVVEPYQKVAELSPLGMVTVVTDDEANWVVPNVAPLDPLAVRFTVRAPPVVIGVPELVCRRTTIGPRFGLVDSAPMTAGEVNIRAGVVMVSVSCWVESGPMPLVALTQTAYVPRSPAVGVPESSPLAEKMTPEGSVDGVQPLNPVSEKAGAGIPEAVTWKLLGIPTAKLATSALVMAGAPLLHGDGAGVPEVAGAALVVPENWASGALTQRVWMS
jgi:hypothetical protein